MKTTAPALLLASVAALAACGSAFAQQPARPAIAQPSLYAVSSAAIATAMTWCTAKHGALTQGSQGAACFSRARGILAGFGLQQRSQQIDAACSDAATFNTCLTPQIGRLVYALHEEFTKQGL